VGDQRTLAWSIPWPADESAFEPETIALWRDLAASIKAEPGNGERWRRLGLAYHARQQWPLALDAYGEAVKRSPAAARAWYDLALAAHAIGMSGRALEHMDRAIAAEPGFAPAHWRKGLWLLDQGDVAGAEAAARRANDIDPRDLFGSLTLARALIQGGKSDEACAVLDAVIAGAPGSWYPHFLRGTAYRTLGRTEEAEREFNTGRGGEPTWRDPWMDEINQYMAGFDADMARVAQLMAGPDPRQAVALLESLRERKPGNPHVLLNLGIAYARTNRLDNAIDVFKTALKDQPNFVMAHLHLAAAYVEQTNRRGGRDAGGVLAAALEHCNRVIEYAPTFPQGHGVRANVLVAMGRRDDALASLMQAATLEPENSRWLLMAGDLQWQLGRHEEARATLASLKRQAPDDPEVEQALARIRASPSQPGGGAVASRPETPRVKP